MEESILIGKVYMDCPLCDKKHDVEERKRLKVIRYFMKSAFFVV